uniref:Succinate:cytochrome c oxidoreductase subunit 4 n=1 Tax=Thorea hispida TaxID=202687 RepID=A0A1Z1XAY4_9FLOR|nr:succinate:cytochrome c oxidoreductase subunit 4 [Thorea hispida]ARX95976.1 succinate:cytochrome c oxidoreductase subunit 4 [Thorea hispida]
MFYSFVIRNLSSPISRRNSFICFLFTSTIYIKVLFLFLVSFINFSWWLVRISGLLFLPTMFCDIEVFFLLLSLIYFHINSGVYSVFLDYVHNLKLFEIFLLFLRLLSLEFITLFVEVFL